MQQLQIREYGIRNLPKQTRGATAQDFYAAHHNKLHRTSYANWQAIPCVTQMPRQSYHVMDGSCDWLVPVVVAEPKSGVIRQGQHSGRALPSRLILLVLD